MKKPAELSLEDAQALLKRMAGGDESALRELHDTYARRIFIFAMSTLRKAEAAEPEVTDTPSEVLKHPDRSRA